MDWFSGAPPPPEYQAVAWLVNIATVVETVGWTINYGESIYRSVKDRTYGMAIFPMCLNLSWEIVYTLVYPCNDTYQWIMIISWLLVNPGIVLSAIRYAPNEWQHAPLVKDNIRLIFFLTIVACILGQLAAAATLGPGVAATVIACLCYLLLTVGSLCQLLVRGSSRGTSYTMWASRFLGNLAAGLSAHLKLKYWPQIFGFLDSPLMTWFVAITTIVELCYLFVLRHIQAKESADRQNLLITDKKR